MTALQLVTGNRDWAEVVPTLPAVHERFAAVIPCNARGCARCSNFAAARRPISLRSRHAPSLPVGVADDEAGVSLLSGPGNAAIEPRCSPRDRSLSRWSPSSEH